MPLPPDEAKVVPAEYKALLRTVSAAGQTTRPELVAQSGLPRSSVAARVKELLDGGLLVETGQTESTGGRRATGLAFPPDMGMVLALELGSTHARWRVSTFAQEVVAGAELTVTISAGSRKVLGQVAASVSAALEGVGVSKGAIRACALGFPGPVDFRVGRVTGPPNMAGWDHATLPELMADWMGAPAVVDNDVNIMALGEHRAVWRPEGVDNLLFIKHGTGIGCGIIADGEVFRGADGTAGEVGHMHVAGSQSTELCSCGGNNCLEVLASGKALVRRLRAHGYEVATATEVAQLVLSGDVVAMNAVRDAGRALGEIMGGIVNFFNPSVLVTGGSIGSLGVPLLAGLREAVYAQATMFSTRHLRIVPSRLGRDAGPRGATLLALELAYDEAIRRSMTVDGFGGSTPATSAKARGWE